MKHTNNGNCKRCLEILYRYPNPDKDLVLWWVGFQMEHPEAHISCAGRGRMDQEALKVRGASRASYGESAHNYNAAIDIFEQGGDGKNIYEKQWFFDVLAPSLPDFLKWYGWPGSKFLELPHVEREDWRALAKLGELKLVEP